MNAYSFAESLLNVYEKKNNSPVTLIQKGNFTDYAFSGFSESQLKMPMTKKVAAKILHEFLLRILALPDVEWKTAGSLKDIYECKVCANSIAQVYERNLIPPKASDVFGIGNIFDDSLMQELTTKLYEIM